jgi:hypothetical protein
MKKYFAQKTLETTSTTPTAEALSGNNTQDMSSNITTLASSNNKDKPDTSLHSPQKIIK